jgi:hypothetical protein
MTDDPRGVERIPVGMPVLGFDGSLLGEVREVQSHYLLVGREGDHTDLEVPVHAILGVTEGRLQVSVNREAATEVDDVEAARRMGQE